MIETLQPDVLHQFAFDQAMDKKTRLLSSVKKTWSTHDDDEEEAEAPGVYSSNGSSCCPDCKNWSVLWEGEAERDMTFTERTMSSSSSSSSTATIGNPNNTFYTLCQVRQHNTMDSAWILVGTDICDVTSYLQEHPGGANSLLRRAGGVKDCTEDFRFHSKRRRKMWDKFKIGRLGECSASETTTRRNTLKSPWWMYWNQ